jgi:hypothetical protein
MNTYDQVKENAATHRTFTTVCFACCQKLTARIEKTRDAIMNEFRETLDANEHLLRLALNEAEALAWETEFPHLLFPTLAVEKAQALVAWSARQQSIKQNSSRFALAA